MTYITILALNIVLFTYCPRLQNVDILEMYQVEGSHSGLVRAPAKRLGAQKAPPGFESLSLRQ